MNGERGNLKLLSHILDVAPRPQKFRLRIYRLVMDGVRQFAFDEEPERDRRLAEQLGVFQQHLHIDLYPPGSQEWEHLFLLTEAVELIERIFLCRPAEYHPTSTNKLNQLETIELFIDGLEEMPEETVLKLKNIQLGTGVEITVRWKYEEILFRVAKNGVCKTRSGGQ
jgi:hypothetical protein